MLAQKSMRENVIDATGKTLGRVASEAAKMLMGKTLASYVPHDPPRARVAVEHAGKIRITENKRRTASTRYSGYPGGLKYMTLGSIIARSGKAEVLRRAVKGMLPRNRLLTERMKRLTISE